MKQMNNAMNQRMNAAKPAQQNAQESDPEFEALAAQLEALLDQQDIDTPALHDTYRRAMRLELGFFEAAFRA